MGHVCILYGLMLVLLFKGCCSKDSPLRVCPDPPDIAPCEDECNTDDDCPPGTICCPGVCKREFPDGGDAHYRTCVVLDVCDTGVCKHNADCLRQPKGKYSCICPAGTQGNNCEIDINECASNPCQNGGTCDDLLGDFKCCCPPGYTGKQCDIESTCPDLSDQCATAACTNIPEAKCSTKVVFTIINENGDEEDVTDFCGPQTSQP